MDDVHRRHCTALANMLAANPHRHNQTVWLTPNETNECGTAGCAAGWAALAQLGLIEIGDDGTMTWEDDALLPWFYSLEQRTLYSESRDVGAKENGRKWLGLSPAAAYALFITTTEFMQPEELAVEVLRRLGDGRLSERDLARSPSVLSEIDDQLP